MWSKTHSITVPGLKPSQIWRLWSDVNHWHLWDDGIESAELVGEFAPGAVFYLKPKGASKVQLTLLECVLNRSFTDCTQFLGAKMYGMHHMQETPDGLRLTTTIKITGMLSFLWRKLVAEKIAADEPQQLAKLVALAAKL